MLNSGVLIQSPLPDSVMLPVAGLSWYVAPKVEFSYRFDPFSFSCPDASRLLSDFACSGSAICSDLAVWLRPLAVAVKVASIVGSAAVRPIAPFKDTVASPIATDPSMGDGVCAIKDCISPMVPLTAPFMPSMLADISTKAVGFPLGRETVSVIAVTLVVGPVA